jgi:hypothetical protein
MHANAKQHIVSHLIGEGVGQDARFQDGHVAKSDTNGGEWRHGEMSSSERLLSGFGMRRC